eukprot:763673-Rhodomonas_salina.3
MPRQQQLRFKEEKRAGSPVAAPNQPVTEPFYLCDLNPSGLRPRIGLRCSHRSGEPRAGSLPLSGLCESR